MVDYNNDPQDDELNVANMFLNQSLPYDPDAAIQKQWLSTNDSNNGSYDAGIDIQLPNLGSMYVPLNEMRLTGAIELTSTGTPFNGTETIAFPFGLQGLIYSVQLRSDNGVNILTDVDNVLSNWARYLNNVVQNNNTDEESQFMTIPDAENATTLFAGGDLYTVTPRTSYNEQDIIITKNRGNAVYDPIGPGTSGAPLPTWYIKFDIPLVNLHDYFTKMDFLLANVGLLFNFQTTLTGVGTKYKYVTIQTDGNASTAVAFTGKISRANKFAQGNTCRLYYPYVIPSATDLVRINALLNAGWRKDIEFSTHNYRKFTMIGVQDGTVFSDNIMSAVTLPEKVHIFVTPRDYYTQVSHNQVTQTSTVPGVIPTGFCASNAVPVPLTNIQIEVNGKQYFSNPPQNLDERWNYMKENLFSRGNSDVVKPLLTQTQLSNPLCGYASFDISRLQERTGFQYVAVPIRLTFTFFDPNIRTLAQTYQQYVGTTTLTAGNPTTMDCDVHVIVEKAYKMQFQISTGNVKIITGFTPSS